ncbi:MAG: asparagine synthase (glutamine-hydrolyzing) [Spirochaetes bacterium]|nr:asparagine synthase (glutamine-hydrolyzing) [Spirochaetota bacterium]
MCGIAGIYHTNSKRPVEKSVLDKMASTLTHRGPDENGCYVNNNTGIAHTRLSIIDLSGGSQPIFNEDKNLCVVFNGEIFNYIELKDFLEKKGHKFRTHSDTEVIVHAYEEYGKDCFKHFNGQFAIALWNEREKELILARDRVGIRPVYYSSLPDGTFVFASEVKAILKYPGIVPEIDPAGLNQVFTLWVNIPPKTVFKGVHELAPGSFMSVSSKGISTNTFWKMQFPDANDYEDKPLSFYTGKLKEALYDATTIRLRADVPVAAYLSGGLDSSIITSLVKKYHNNDLITFSVAFSDGKFDERKFQNDMVKYINTDHRVIEATYDNIGSEFSNVVWYSEKPMIRTAPAPLYLLSGLVRDNGIKVVLTGEGADEFFGGYNIFKEDKIRRFWARIPGSKKRPGLLKTLYPYITREPKMERFWQSFFKKGLTDTGNKYYSHLIRWNNTSQIKQFFSSRYKERFSEDAVFQELDNYIDPDIDRWHPFCKAQYLEARLFLPGYLLSTQGDRMMMGNSIEGRFPFLDHNVIEFANTIPPEYKMYGLNEKYILKKAFNDILPDPVVYRPKQPYRAPINQCFMRDNLASSMINEEIIKKYGYFEFDNIRLLLNKFRNPDIKNISERDDMSIVGVVSTQLLHHHFIEDTFNEYHNFHK